MKKKKTKFYKSIERETKGVNFNEKFGINSSWKWHNDPRQFFISLSRYKFVAKILSGKKKVLEIGCSDGFNSRLVKQEVRSLDICDIDHDLLDEAKKINKKKWFINIFYHDFLKKKITKKYDGVYMLDVLEHVSKIQETKFLKNIISSLNANGILVVGIPSLEFQKYSRPIRVSGHINCKTSKNLKKTLEKFFYNVVIFSMNDEIVHTGFEKMSCYLFAMCFNKKKTK